MKRLPKKPRKLALRKLTKAIPEPTCDGAAKSAPERKVLRPYQVKIFGYTLKTRHPFLIVEMRLGKCLITIRRTKLYRPRNKARGLKVLVICPPEAIGGWQDELESEGETYETLTGGSKARLDILETSQARWFVMNNHVAGFVQEIADYQWDCVVIDESWIRNPKTKSTKFVTKNFRTVPHRWLLTGTPRPESYLEYFTQLQWLDGHAFGYANYWTFRAKEFHAARFDWQPNSGVRQRIDSYVGKRAYILSRKEAGVEPVKVKQRRSYEFDGPARTLYRRIEKEYAISPDNRTLWETTKYIWLRKLCGGFSDDQFTWSGKFDGLISLLNGELRNEPAVVWFHFNQELRYAERELRKRGITCGVMLGDSQRHARETIRRDFQAGRFRVILVQELCARMGCDLSRADTAIYFGRNPSHWTDTQTADRIVRIGKRAPLLYLYLTVKDSVDEDLYLEMNGKNWHSSLSLSRALKERMRKRHELVKRTPT